MLPDPAWKIFGDSYDEMVKEREEERARNKVIRKALEHDCDPEAALEYYGLGEWLDIQEKH